MKEIALLTLAIPALAVAQTAEPAPMPESPSDVIEAAEPEDWRPIAAENLMVMTLGSGAEVFIELAPDFAPVHVENIRIMARTGWYDDMTVNRVQDNYVVQWGHIEGDLPDDLANEDPAAPPTPEGVVDQPPAEYEISTTGSGDGSIALWHPRNSLLDVYADWAWFESGWPETSEISEDTRTLSRSLTHCYGMVGVGRGNNPDTGSGVELYTVIGHAPRHLDRNIALVGRVIEGIEHLSSLPRGTGTLGFYENEEERTPITTVRLASQMPDAQRPHFQVMRTDGEIFRRYVHARANRAGWFVRPAGAVDVCNVLLPIRRVEETG